MLPTRTRPPAAPEETILNPAQGYFSVIVPEATVNYVPNPSGELSTANYTGYNGATISRSATRQRYGAYSLQCAPTANVDDGMSLNLPITVAAGVYTASVDAYLVAGRPYLLELFDGFVRVGVLSLRGVGRWQRLAVTGKITTGTSVRVNLRKDGFASTAPFWADGWQLENKPYATTYCDGDRRGSVDILRDFYWTGVPHASPSVRAATTRAGGRIVNLNQYGFRLLAYIGLGALLINTITMPLTTGGAIAQDQRPAESSLSLVGVMTARDLADLQSQRGSLYGALNPNATPIVQPVTLLYQPTDGDGESSGDQLSLPVYWQPAGGETTSQHHSRVTLDFSLYLPMISKGGRGAALPPQQSVSVFQSMAVRSPAGLWMTGLAGTAGANGTITVIKATPNGSLIFGGDFTSIGGIAANRIAGWNSVSGWFGFGTGANGSVQDVAIMPDGTIYAAGNFTSIGGVAANRIARWNGSVWAPLGSGLNAGAISLAVGLDGTLYVAGSFTLAGGVAAVSLAKWNGSAWSALGTAPNDVVFTLKTGATGLIYVGGAFTSIGGIAANRIAAYNPVGGVWSARGAGVNGDVKAITVRDGVLYVGGSFTQAGGIPTAAVARWNGNQWQAMGAGITATGGTVLDLLTRQDGTILATGSQFTASGSTALLESLAVWNGSAWTPADIDFYDATTAANLSLSLASPAELPDGTLAVAVGYTNGLGRVPVPTMVTSNGTAPTWPRITFTAITTGTTLYQLLNVTTGAAIYFSTGLLAGEKAVLDLTPGQISFTSSLRGSLMSTILDGSDLANWRLQPGANMISAYMSRSDATITMEWEDQVQSLDDATWSPGR